MIKASCMICGEEVNEQSWYEEPWGLVEQHISCDNCDTEYSSVYGQQFLEHQKIFWAWSYNESSEHRESIYKWIEAASLAYRFQNDMTKISVYQVFTAIARIAHVASF